MSEFGDVTPYVCSSYTFSWVRVAITGHILGNSCPLGKPFVLEFCLFGIILGISHFGFKSEIWFFSRRLIGELI